LSGNAPTPIRLLFSVLGYFSWRLLRCRAVFCLLLWLGLGTISVFAQTSWKGTSSASWGTAANWTAGVPTSTVDAIIGDANFTGANQPDITQNSTCKSLTVGAGTVTVALTVDKSLTVSGDITIGSNGTITHNSSTTISLAGNWSNSGTYNGVKSGNK